MNLLPFPRSLKRQAGIFLLPKKQPLLAITFTQTAKAPKHPEGYTLTIDREGVRIKYRETGGLRAAGATLRQLLREYGRSLPCLKIRDWPDFARRGVMLDISRGRVPKLETLLDLVERLADFKINEFQLYTEHTFAYRNYKSVWQDWGALTAAEIRTLDARCRELGIDLVPNQNSFGHLRYFLEHPKVRKLAEVSEPYEGSTGDFLRFPTTLAPNHPGTIKFIRALYDELLPNFTSNFFNVGCDETWDLGRGQSKKICERRGKGRVYVDFLKQIEREVSKRGRKMMFWGDIILNHPDLIKSLPKNVITLNWGYEATHPFEKEAATFAKSKVPFYVCPGTATWMTLLGRHDTAFANLHLAGEAGRKHGAIGYLNTDWGDGGHPQPLAVSWPLYITGAAHSWCSETYNEKLLVPVLSRDVYEDPSQKMAKAAIALGLAHRKFDYLESNVTPFGAVIAAPPPAWRELFCRSGLKYYARIKARKILAAWAEVEKNRGNLAKAKPTTSAGAILQQELDLAARMATESCRIMLWQQALATGNTGEAKQLARSGIAALRRIERDFKAYWPARNKATTAKCAPFLQWRIADYQRGKLHFAPEVARVTKAKTYAAE
jgi:hexosaminidase